MYMILSCSNGNLSKNLDNRSSKVEFDWHKIGEIHFVFKLFIISELNF